MYHKHKKRPKRAKIGAETGTKYGNSKIEIDGILFASKREARRFSELQQLQDAGLIEDLLTQVPYVLIPAQYEKTDKVYTKGLHKGEAKRGKCIEKAVTYVADFVYKRDGKIVVEDTKGFRTKDYVIKRKLMLYVHGIVIVEV